MDSALDMVIANAVIMLVTRSLALEIKDLGNIVHALNTTLCIQAMPASLQKSATMLLASLYDF